MNDYSYSNTYPNGYEPKALLGVKETFADATMLADEYKEKGVRTYIEHAGLQKGAEVVGAFAVYAHIDDVEKLWRE